MTRTRLLIVAGLLAVVFGLGMGAAALIPEGPGVTKGNFDRIEKGMTSAEVEALFGGEGWNYRVGGTDKDWNGFLWRGDDDSAANIEFINHCVARKYWVNSDETFLDKIRRWLHLS